MKSTIIFGGEAGQGPNILTHLTGEILVKKGFYVFYSRDYQSLIRGGHNFNSLTYSDSPVFSNESKFDIIVALDEKTKKIHEKNLKKNGTILSGKNPNMYFAGRLMKKIGVEFKDLENQLKNLERFKENLNQAKRGYEEEKEIWKIPKISKKNLDFINGNQGISLGALRSGIDIYYAYPMTPATPILSELAKKQKKEKILVLELENEIGVVNAAIGSAITGAKSMVGTSGGGFDLMSESLSLTGIAEIPLVFYLSQRTGPGTGVATYNSQGDLNIARHAGHGEFQRIVLAPGDPNEAKELANQCFYFSQKYKVPAILIGDKHLAESFYSLEKKPKFVDVGKEAKFGRYTSYEKDSQGSATEDPEIVKKNVEKRSEKQNKILKESKKFKQYKIFGKKNSKNVILFWGSTKGAVIDAVKELNSCAIQILYIEPFPEISKLIKNKNLILVENNSTGLLGNLIREKTGIEIKNKILKYDARPFYSDKLKEEIKKKLK